jgi:nucleotide-binding universal stress UspA family protein
VDLIVLGSHGASGVAALTVGSTAERVARRAGCSVLVARGEGQLPKRIVIGTDLSGAGREGIHAGVLLAEECGAYATLAHVHVASGPRPELVSDEAQLVLRRKLGQLAERQPIALETKLLVDEHPVTGLMSFAEDEDTDVIVVAAQGLSAMERLLIGSVSERLVRHAPCSVLVAR